MWWLGGVLVRGVVGEQGGGEKVRNVKICNFIYLDKRFLGRGEGGEGGGGGGGGGGEGGGEGGGGGGGGLRNDYAKWTTRRAKRAEKILAIFTTFSCGKLIFVKEKCIFLM